MGKHGLDLHLDLDDTWVDSGSWSVLAVSCGPGESGFADQVDLVDSDFSVEGWPWDRHFARSTFQYPLEK